MYTLKSIAKRGSSFGGAVALLVATIVPSASVFADALNPLTERSLALSSSSPGWSNTDGSENATYAPPNSGANGQKTGNTFSFKVSTDSTSTPVKAFTFLYCTTPAGNCTNPGNDTTPGTDDFTNQKSDLNVVTSSPSEVSSSDFGTIVDTSTGVVKAVPGYAGYDNGKPGAGHESGIGGAGASVAGNFVVYYNTGSAWAISPVTWTMTASSPDTNTPANNMITLTSSTGQGFASGTQVKVVFFGTTNNYIQNPGAGAFFVRMNTYKDDTTLDDSTILDGGVTVANVMNQSIWIQTKVLETMDFSVGTVDPNTLDSSDGTDGGATPANNVASTLEKALYADATANASHTYKGATKHGICDRVLGNITPNQPTNVLKLGDQTAESSLRTDSTFSTHSYWRLSSNSSAGATVYYSGHTLTNTVGDEIKAIGPTKALPIHGSEQFGLALDNTDLRNVATDTSGLKASYTQEATYENGNDNYNQASPTTGPITRGVHPSTVTDVNGNASWHDPTLYPLQPTANYDQGTGAINASPTAQFAFVRTSDTIPEPLASENNQVVDCVTGKMRYIANIAATTPAGIYTTKVNYIAAPQY
jgi:hypothetical protein